MERLDAVFEWLPELKARAKERMEKSGETPIHTTVGMFGFESPPPERNHEIAGV